MATKTLKYVSMVGGESQHRAVVMEYWSNQPPEIFRQEAWCKLFPDDEHLPLEELEYRPDEIGEGDARTYILIRPDDRDSFGDNDEIIRQFEMGTFCAMQVQSIALGECFDIDG